MKGLKVKELVEHGRVFTDFWLGMVGAGVQGLSEVVGKPRPINEHEHMTIKKLVEGAVDRTAKGVAVALEKAQQAAQVAEYELQMLHRSESEAKNNRTPEPPSEGPSERPFLFGRNDRQP
jgi:hypothetical protein